MALAHRYEFVLLYDVVYGNPNGDPDADNAPRTDPETMLGLVSDVCLKRKIRDYVYLRYGGGERNKDADDGYTMDIFVQHSGILNNLIEEARAAVEVPHPRAGRRRGQRGNHALGQEAQGRAGALAEENAAGNTSAEGNAAAGASADENGAGEAVAANVPTALEKRTQRDLAREYMQKRYYDVRTFGAVMTTGANAGQVLGPVQIMISRSIDRVIPVELSLTRVAVTTAETAANQKSDGTMARKSVIPYALYRVEGFISPKIAEKTGFNEIDLNVLWDALYNMFEFDRSAARGMMSSQRLFIFEHNSELGNAPAHRVLNTIRVRRSESCVGPARSFTDYEVEVDVPPSGVTLREWPSVDAAVSSN